MPKLNQVLFRLIPPGPINDAAMSAYYRFYYNKKHAVENGFCMYLRKKCYEFVFPNNITFKCYENIADDLQRTIPGYSAEYKIKEGDVVIDCGAYIGDFTLYAAKAAGTSGRVIAFEPDPAFCKKLRENIALNKLENVAIIEKGVWSTETKLKFSGGTQGGNLFASGLANNPVSYDVIVTALDTELDKLGIKKVDFIKMDVEGAEIEALKGSQKVLSKNKLHLAIASYHTVNGERTCLGLENVLNSFGYEARTAYPEHLTTYGYVKS